MKKRFWTVIAAVAVLWAPLAFASEKPVRTKRTGSEVAVGGLTVTEQANAKAALHAELSRSLPTGLAASVTSVALTPKDLDELEVQAPFGTAPLRVGIVKTIDEPLGKPFGRAFNTGVIKKNSDGSYIWATQVRTPGAQAIRVQLTDFALPTGAEMFLLGPNGQADGPYTGRGRNGTGEFWTRSIVSDTGTLVLRYSAAPVEVARAKISFAISAIGHIRGRSLETQEKSHDNWPCSDNAACVVDVNCVNTGPAGPAEDAIAKMEWIEGQFINTCTGGLLADTDGGSQIPYFLTANHCLTNDIANLETFFNYTTDSCNGGCPDGLVTGGTPPAASTVGVTVVATGSAADYTLLTLDEAPPAGAVFLGWNNSPIAFNDGASLYRVSNANFGPQVYSEHEVDANTGTCQGWSRGNRIYSTDITGATMGGSSGSPVLNSAGEVVGQLSGCCGFNCGNECDSGNNWTVDGALAAYWNDVEQFLDPQGGCSTNAECDDGQFCTGTETCNAGSCQSSGDPCSGGTTCNEATDSCDAPACDNDGACEAGEDCGNCPGDCRQKVNGNPRSRYCCDGDLPDCGNAQCSENGWVCGGGGGGCSSDAECDDGNYCNGEEACNAGACESGSDPCPGQGCDEGSDQCITCAGARDSCSTNSDCCSGNCKNGTCKGN